MNTGNILTFPLAGAVKFPADDWSYSDPAGFSDQDLRGVVEHFRALSFTEGVGQQSKEFHARLLRALGSRPSSGFAQFAGAESLEERLYDALASAKIHTARIAMYLSSEQRLKLFAQLNSLLDIEEWDPNDLPPSVASFDTFLRLLLILRPPATTWPWCDP